MKGALRERSGLKAEELNAVSTQMQQLIIGKFASRPQKITSKAFFKFLQLIFIKNYHFYMNNNIDGDNFDLFLKNLSLEEHILVQYDVYSFYYTAALKQKQENPLAEKANLTEVEFIRKTFKAMFEKEIDSLVDETNLCFQIRQYNTMAAFLPLFEQLGSIGSSSEFKDKAVVLISIYLFVLKCRTRLSDASEIYEQCHSVLIHNVKHTMKENIRGLFEDCESARTKDAFLLPKPRFTLAQLCQIYFILTLFFFEQLGDKVVERHLRSLGGSVVFDNQALYLMV